MHNLGACGHVEQCLGALAHLGVLRIEQQRANGVANARAAWLTRGQYMQPALLQRSAQQQDLRRFAAPIGSFKAYKEAHRQSIFRWGLGGVSTDMYTQST